MQIGIDEPQNAKPGTQSVFLSQGFRPFFLMAGIYAVLPIAAWLMSVVDVASLPGSFHGVAWHGHEMLFGFATAAVAGFLLTAVPSWTRTPPVQGGALAVLLVIWAAGRFAMWFGWPLGAGFVAAIDLLAIPALVFLAGQPILIQGLRRNYIVLGILGFLFFSNLLMHLEAMGATEDTANFGLRLGVFGFVLLLVLISGRVIPSFTANALRAKGIDYDVRSSPGFDKIVVLCLLAAILGDLFLNTDSGVGEKTSGYLSLLAAGALAVRMRHWGTFKSLGEPIVWVLHLGHAWIVFGFFLKGFADLTGMLPSGGAVHALTAGWVGCRLGPERRQPEGVLPGIRRQLPHQPEW